MVLIALFWAAKILFIDEEEPQKIIPYSIVTDCERNKPFVGPAHTTNKALKHAVFNFFY
jgi:hypothetical protein